jgi:CheY-like chemotaxis protein
VILDGKERVLVVDDDPDVRTATSRVLRARGYAVTDVASGRDALCELNEHDFDLLLTDVVMPGMDGRQLAETALARFPTLPVLYMSGYTDDAVTHHGVQRGDVDLIEKPFPNHALEAKVRQMLDRADG